MLKDMYKFKDASATELREAILACNTLGEVWGILHSSVHDCGKDQPRWVQDRVFVTLTREVRDAAVKIEHDLRTYDASTVRVWIHPDRVGY